MQEESLKNMSTIGQRVRLVRAKLDITQSEMAERMGFVRNYISLVENGRADPSHRFIKELDLLEQAPLMQHFEHEGVVREEPFGSHGSFGSSPRGRLKVRRKELGFSLEELSKRTGIVKSALRNIEEGHSRASEEQLRSLASRSRSPSRGPYGGSDIRT